MQEKETAVVLFNPNKNVYFASAFNGHYMLPTFEPGKRAGQKVAQDILNHYHLKGLPQFKGIAFKHFLLKTEIETLYLYLVADDFQHSELEARPITKADLQNDLGILCVLVHAMIQNRFKDDVQAVHYYFNKLNQCTDFKKEIYNGTEDPVFEREKDANYV